MGYGHNSINYVGLKNYRTLPAFQGLCWEILHAIPNQMIHVLYWFQKQHCPSPWVLYIREYQHCSTFSIYIIIFHSLYIVCGLGWTSPCVVVQSRLKTLGGLWISQTSHETLEQAADFLSMCADMEVPIRNKLRAYHGVLWAWTFRLKTPPCGPGIRGWCQETPYIFLCKFWFYITLRLQIKNKTFLLFSHRQSP